MIPQGKNFASMKELADHLASTGFTVIPLNPYKGNGTDCKKPLVRWTEYSKISPTTEQVSTWWTSCPDANLGIITGKGLVVIDADSDEASTWVKSNLPPTGWSVKTSKGVHYYYYCAEEVRNSVNKNISVDVRGSGGYVVGPWSRHQSGHYYVPTILGERPGVITAADVDKCRPGFTPRTQVSVVDADGKMSINLSCVTAFKVPVQVDLTKQPAPVGGRNNAVAAMVGQLIHKGHTEKEIKDIIHSTNAGWEEPLPVEEITTTVESVIRTHTRNNPGAPVLYSKPTAPVKVESGFKFKEFDHSLIPTGLIGELTVWIESRARRSCPMFSMAAAISMLSLLISRKYKDSAHTKANLFMVMVGPSGSGKDNGMKSIEKAISKCGLTDRLSQGIGSDSALSHEMTKSPAKLFLIDELGKIFSANMRNNTASHKAQIISKLLKLYSASSGMYKEDDLVGRPAGMVQDPHLNIYGATTPEEFFPAFDKASFTNGMMGRFFILETQKVTPIKRDIEISDDGVSDVLLAKLNQIRRITDSETAVDVCINPQAEPEYVLTALTPGAAELAFNMAKSFDEEPATADKEMDRIFYAIRRRAMEIVRKLALIRAISDNPYGKVEEGHLIWAKKLVEWSVNNIMACVEVWHHKSSKDMHSKKLVDSIKRSKNGLSFAQMSGVFLYLPAAQRAEIIKDLCDSGQVITQGSKYVLAGEKE